MSTTASGTIEPDESFTRTWRYKLGLTLIVGGNRAGRRLVGEVPQDFRVADVTELDK